MGLDPTTAGSWPELKSRDGCSTDWATQAPQASFFVLTFHWFSQLKSHNQNCKDNGQNCGNKWPWPIGSTQLNLWEQKHLREPLLVEHPACRGHTGFSRGSREPPLTWWLGQEEVSFKSFCHTDSLVLSRPNIYWALRLQYFIKGLKYLFQSFTRMGETRSYA